jgi:hypothetical protein
MPKWGREVKLTALFVINRHSLLSRLILAFESLREDSKQEATISCIIFLFFGGTCHVASRISFGLLDLWFTPPQGNNCVYKLL